MTRPRQGIRFRKGMSVGNIDAEFDGLLKQAFVHTGDLDVLVDTKNPKSITVGRTGSGKTALLLKLEDYKEHVLRVHPDTLSLQYLSNSTILPQLAKLGVHLEVFYQLLWRHVFVMELIRDRFDLVDEGGQRSFLQRLSDLFVPNKAEKEALEYYRQWNPSYWESAEVRVREITSSLDERVKAAVGVSMFSVGAEEGETSTVRTEIAEKAQRIVSEVSLEKIRVGMTIIEKRVLNDPQKPYYIIIDDLDKGWIDIQFAYDLIEALLEVVAAFAKMPNVKVVVALRENIVEILHGRGGKQRQQREKQENLFLHLRWTPGQLEDLINRRLEQVVRSSYGGPITLESLLPPARGRKKTLSGKDVVVARTFNRPRDLIDFVNRCIDVAIEQSSNKVTWTMLREAEKRYSRTRLRSLEDEWHDRYSGLGIIFQAVEGMQDGFNLSELDDNRLTLVLLEGEKSIDPTSIPALCYQMSESRRSFNDLWRFIIAILLRISVLGVKASAQERTVFSYETLDPAYTTVSEEATYYFHPALYWSLRIANPAQGY
jgi:hypothetical protein